MRQLARFAAIVVVVVGALAGCKSKDDKQADAVDKARGNVATKEAQLVAKQEQVVQAKANLDKARTDFIALVDERMAALDLRIVQSQTNTVTDQHVVGSLRAEAVALRARAADPAQPLAPDATVTFQSILDKLDLELQRK